MHNVQKKQHPAAEWASGQVFNTTETDCTTTVVLKILDGKCKMLPGEKDAVIEIYNVVRGNRSVLFTDEDHATIDMAQQHDDSVFERIHELRLYAEQCIPKPVMRKYKMMLRDGLFG